MRRALPLIGLAAWLAFSSPVASQGTFQNLDFEDGTFIPISGDPYNRVYWESAMPGWTGYLGGVPVDRILHNDFLLDSPSMAIWGPDYPSADLMHGQFFMVLMPGTFPNGSYAETSISQTGTIPLETQSIRYWTDLRINPGFSVSFGGESISLVLLGETPNGRWIWGGDVTSFAGQTGELRFAGGTYLDNIEFSPIPIPEPTAFVLLGISGLLFGARSRRIRES